jgi:HAE1 family hydrophobic/amphiphilic exporter-1
LKRIIEKPVVSILIFASILLLGIYSIKNTPVELIPDEKLPSLSITSFWPGVSADMILRKIALPVEEQVSQVRWIKKIKTQCDEGNMNINVEFSKKANMEMVYVLLKERLNRLRDKIPPQANFPKIVPYVPDEFKKKAFISFGIFGHYSVNTLKDIAEKDIAPILRAVQGVDNLQIFGGSEPQIEIKLDITKMKKYNVSVGEIYTAINNNFFLLPSINSEYFKKEITLSLSQNVKKIPEIENLIVKRNGNTILRIKELGRVRLAYKKIRNEQRYNGMPVVSIDIFKQSEVSTLHLSKILKGKIALIEHKFGLKTKIIQDESKELIKRLTKLGKLSALILFTIFIILFVVVKDVKASILVFSSVVFSVFATLTLVYIFKIPLNLLTLSGFALGFGIFVDNAVVVFDNILRHREYGEDNLTSAVNGSKEMIMPVFASTLTTIIVFFSFAYFQGRLKLYYLPLAQLISLALLSSVFVAFTLIPAVSTKMNFKIKTKKIKDKKGGFFKFIIRYPLFIILPILVIMFFSYKIFLKETTFGRFFSWYRKQSLIVWLRMPSGSEFKDTKKTMLEFEKLAVAKKYEKEVKAQIFERSAQMEISFPEKIEFSSYPYILKQELISLATNMAGIGISISGFDPQGYSYSPEISSWLPYSITIKGYNFVKLMKIANNLKKALLSNRRIQEVDIITQSGFFWGSKSKYYQMEIDYNAINKYDITPRYIVYIMSSLLNSSFARNKMVYNDREMDYAIKFNLPKQVELSDIMMKEFKSPTGIPFRLKDILKIKEKFFKAGISRENQEFIAKISWDYLGSSKRGEKLHKAFYKGITLPAGFTKSQEEYSWMMKKGEKKQLIFAIILSLILIYLVLGALYESFIQPILIMLSIPLALIGVFLGFALANQFGTFSFDSTAYIGVILLSGIVVNNAIILVDHINNYRNRGFPISEAVSKGARERVRPVLMTATTTVLGMLPLVIFHKAGQTDIWTSLALCTVGGLTASSILIFLIIPIFYDIFEKMKEYFKRI